MKDFGNSFGSIVLGINDGLIELTGVLVGLTFVLKDHNLVALSGLVTGIAAALSMAASAFMQARHDAKNAPRAALITGISYIIVVLMLVAPYFVFAKLTISLPVMLGIALGIVAFVSYFNALYLKQSYIREFGLMFVASLGVAAVSYVIGNLLSRLLVRG